MLSLAVLLVGIFGFVILVGQAENKKIAFEPTKSADKKNQDSDNDGLADWEEQLLGTDPFDADTDGDGFLDGEEVLSKHNPSIPSPNDNLEYLEIEKEFAEKLKEPKNLSEAMMENTATLALNPNAPGDPALLNEAIKGEGGSEFYTQALRKQLILTLFEFMAPAIKESDIKKVAYDLPNLANYLRGLNDLFASQKNMAFLTDGQAAQMAAQNRQFRSSDLIAEQWQDIYQKSREMSVPEPLVRPHILSLQAAYTLSRGYGALREMDEDPAKVIIALQQIQKGHEMFVSAFEQIKAINSTL